MDTTVLERRQESADTVTLRVRYSGPIRPGQFIMLGARIGEDAREVKRSYSVAAIGEGWVEITVRAQPQGALSPYLTARMPGDSLFLYGPFGKHFLWDPNAHDIATAVVFIAGGTGLAPFRAMIQDAQRTDFAANGGKGIVIFSVRSSADILYRDELPSWSPAGFSVVTTLTRPSEHDVSTWKGAFGRINGKLLQATLGDVLQRASFFICGPTPLVVDVQTMLAGLGVEPSRIVTEKYGAIEG